MGQDFTKPPAETVPPRSHTRSRASHVRKVRGAAARTRRANSLKQIGLAVHTDYGATDKLPPFGYAPTEHHSGFLGLLPYLGQDTLARQYNPAKRVRDEEQASSAGLDARE